MSRFYTHIYASWHRLRARLARDTSLDLARQIEREQWLPTAEVERLQLERLSRLWTHAREKSSFYRERLPVDSPRTLADLPRIAPLTRQDIQIDATRIVCETGAPRFANATGGSTGNPVNFFQDAEYKRWSDALELLFLTWMDVMPGDKTAAFWGADRDFSEQSVKEKLAMRIKRIRALNSFRVTDDAMTTFLRALAQWHPHYVIGYASSLAQAADALLARPNVQVRPHAVRSSAEMLYDEQRVKIEQAFDTRVYNFYGSREVSHLAAQCNRYDGLHIFSAGRIVEVCDESGKPVPPETPGYLLITDLTNFTFPFIRYRIGDMAEWTRTPCPCGRTWPLLRKILGRSSDILTVDGKQIHGEFFTHLFYGRPEVKQFQVVLEPGDLLVVRIVGDEKLVDRADIERVMRTVAGQRVTVRFEFVESIPPLPSGKFRFTVNNTR